MLHELRVYEAMPGKLPALNDRFADHTVGFFKKHGIGVVGFWTEEFGTSNRLTYILSFESMADRESRWNAFQADPDWQSRRAETEVQGPLVERYHNVFMRLTAYSPQPKISSSVQELRVYEAMPGKLPALHDRFAKYTDSFFKKHGMGVVGYWTEEVGTSNQLVYMLGYPSLVDREKCWAAFQADPDWLAARAQTELGGPLVKRFHNSILRPTAYSPR